MTSLAGAVSRLDLTWRAFGEVKHKMLDPSKYILSACEVLLAKQLKSLCFANGREKNETESAEILRQLAVVYRLKSPHKLSLIQSGALFNAAAAREPDNLKEIADNLRELCSHVVKLAGAKETDIVTQTDVFFDLVEKMRSEVEKKLETLPKLSENVSKDERKEMEAARVEEISKIQTFVTGEYSNVMKEIMKYCVDVNGPSPCKYALVGMGSLARNEITPHSDFENVILLEEGVQHRPDYEEVLEYFRWVSVMFQLILVNFGETLIRFMNIDGLNNPYKKEDDWFYDNHTPCGISPDGFAPHASKNPLGRPQTRQKPWDTELIKPVSGMLTYLKVSEDLKNGYHLADILLKTCFVHGNHQVYDEFCSGVKDFQNQAPNLITFREQLQEDLQNFDAMSRILSVNFRQRFDMKRTIFRSVTIFIAALGRYHQLNSSSSLDIIRELEEKMIIDENFGSQLKFAVAVACEIRLKVYMEHRAQVDQLYWNSAEYGIKNLGVVEAVGVDSLAALFQTAEILQEFVGDSILGPIESSENKDVESTPMETLKSKNSERNMKPGICMVFGLYERAIEKCQEHLKAHPISKQHPWLEVMIVHSLYRLSRFEEANEKCISLLNTGHVLRKELLCMAGESLLKLGRYKEGLVQLEMALSLFPDDNFCDMLKADCLFRMGECLFRLDQFTVALHNFDSAQNIYRQAGIEETVVHCLDMKGKSLFNLGLIELALGTFHEMLNKQRRLTEDESNDGDIAETLNLVHLCLVQLDRSQEAVAYKEEELDIHENILEQLEDVSNECSTVDQVVACKIAVADCLVKLGRKDDAIECRSEAVQDLEVTLKVKGLAHAEKLEYLKTLGQCYVDLEQYEKAMEMFEQEIQLRLAVDTAGTNLVLAKCYHLYGECLIQNNNKTKAFAIFERELKILSKAVNENPCNKGEIVGKKGQCLVSLEMYIEASESFKEQLRWEENAVSFSSNSPFWSLLKDLKLANCYRAIGFCLDMSANYKEALIHYNLELGIRRRLAKSSRTSVPVADCLVQIGFCYFKMGCIQDSLDIFISSIKISMDSACSTTASNICFLALLGKAKCLYELGNNNKEVVDVCISAVTYLTRSWQNPNEKLRMKSWLDWINNRRCVATKQQCFEEISSFEASFKETKYCRLLECFRLAIASLSDSNKQQLNLFQSSYNSQLSP